jgi:hypothetical protein
VKNSRKQYILCICLLFFFLGILTNIQNLIVASGQEATFSSVTRTATYKDGVLTAQEAGAYRFARFTIKDYATVTFETTGKALQLTILELHYGSTLKGEKILLQSNEITLQPGSTIVLSGGGYGAEQGPGKGMKVRLRTASNQCLFVHSLHSEGYPKFHFANVMQVVLELGICTRLFRIGMGFMVFNATFNNISVILLRSVLLVEETRVPGENNRPVTSH